MPKDSIITDLLGTWEVGQTEGIHQKMLLFHFQGGGLSEESSISFNQNNKIRIGNKEENVLNFGNTKNANWKLNIKNNLEITLANGEKFIFTMVKLEKFLILYLVQ